ncbi:sarcoplasmic calcium-binding protein [Lingula anatina]|uniref:Sarcoplasmic calcium-binding protein n=1 Tax=Lingula anatina TaxID=7574 RepID=A0A1S3JAQ8_LINAN|nr:sarcoplasmic calcium-binding protein [Lingula anatina]|eukprot:XP_013407490.1 sarcoplasmic calcium-binding protein [Lingula anatina]
MAGFFLRARILNGVLFRGLSKKAINLERPPHDYPIVTGSEHWRRKLRTLFKARDTDGDGYISRQDYVLCADRVASYMNLNETRAIELMNKQLLMWELVSGTTDASGDIKISEDEYMSNILNGNHKSMGMGLDIVCCDFDSVDVNSDGFISQQEHKAFFYGRGIPVKHSTDVFKVLDTDGDGKLSKEEFVQGYVDFIYSEDESSPHVSFMGPLV